MKVRLAEIDAPEKKHPFGSRAKEALSNLTFQKEVSVHLVKQDRYGRSLAHVVADGRNINFAMVEQGFAWCYDQYLKDVACYQKQTDAQQSRRGLWSDPTPLAPWEYRKQRRQSGPPP